MINIHDIADRKYKNSILNKVVFIFKIALIVLFVVIPVTIFVTLTALTAYLIGSFIDYIKRVLRSILWVR